MIQTTIFGPMLALVGWTLGVLCLVAYRRFKAAFAGRVAACDFEVGESGAVPDDVRIVNRAFMNLTEVPVLFYTVCLILHLTGTATQGNAGFGVVVCHPAHRPQPCLSHL